MGVVSSRWKKAVLAGTALVVLGAPPFLPPYYTYLATELIIWGLLAISLDLLIGYTGLPSFGHALFFGVPAYVLGIIAVNGGTVVVALAAAALAMAVVVVVVGFFATRTGGVGYIIVTLLCSFAVFIVAFSWTGVTGGENGLYLPKSASLSNLSDEVRYILVACIGVGVWACANKLVHSNFGHVLLGIKVNEARMQALGYDTRRLKFQITAISGAIAGLAGILYALVVRTLSADLVGPELSTEIVIWVLLGGAQTLIGPVIGAALFIALKQILNEITAYPMLLGLLFVVVVVWLPSGLISLRLPRSLAIASRSAKRS